jgi:hypothetical protein
MVLSIQSRSEKIWIHHYPWQAAVLFQARFVCFHKSFAGILLYQVIDRVLWIKTMLKRKFITRFLLLHRITLLYRNLKDIDISM